MRFKGIVISLIVIAVLVVICASVQPSYDGKAKIVLKLVQIPPTPTPMPLSAQGSSNDFAEPATTFGFPTVDVPQGTILQASVLYSEDPALKAGDTCSLLVDYDNSNVPAAMQSGLLDKLLPGAIVGVNDYTLNGGQVKVDLTNTAAWDQKIFIVDISRATPGESSNPFRVDLNLFKDFSTTLPLGNTVSRLTPIATPMPSLLRDSSQTARTSAFPVQDTPYTFHGIFAGFPEAAPMKPA